MVFSTLAERFDLSSFHYAHRGLWAAGGLSENSLEACLAAAKAGFGIEFDVRPSADRIPMVFHDPILDRMTTHTGMFASYSADELERMSLIGGGYIHRLDTLLDAWPAKTPLLCEIKVDGDTDPVSFTEIVCEHINRHNGPAAIMSFSIPAVQAVPPAITRGQLLPPKDHIGDQALESLLAMLGESPPDYLAGHANDAGQLQDPATQMGLPLILWTVTSLDQFQSLKACSSAQIFEGFDPRMANPSAAPIS